MAISTLNQLSSSKLRLSGLSSGLDTESIVKNMMQIEQLKVNRELRSKTTLQWKQDALQDVSGGLKELRQTFMSVLSPKNIYSQDAFLAYTVKTFGNADEAISVKAGALAAAGRVTVREVRQLAEAAKAASADPVAQGGGQLDLGAEIGKANFEKELVFGGGEISFSINGQVFSFGKEATMNDVIKEVNGRKDAGVTMQYSELTKKLSIRSDETGQKAALTIKNISGNAFGAGGAFGIAEGEYEGQDAVAVFEDGSAEGIEVRQGENTFTLDGITYTLNRVTDKPVDIVLTRDIGASVEKIKEFVEGYNSLIARLDDMVSTRKTNRERGYLPLTDEEKALMSEKQIEDWENIAKKGLLYNDPGLKGMLDSLRGALYETVAGAGLSPADIGLKTGNYFEGKKGQIFLDEDVLRKALEETPDKVMSVFTDLSKAADPDTAYRENGFLNRVMNIMTHYTSVSQRNSMDSIDRTMKDLNDRIERLEARMLEQEERLYQRFAAMEKAMAQMNEQSSWLSAMLGGGNN